MSDDRIRTLVAELDGLVPRSGAFVRETARFYNDDDDPALRGNRLGYLRLGIELMKVADLPALRESPTLVAHDLSYLVEPDPNSAVAGFAPFERREDLPHWNDEETERRKQPRVRPWMIIASIVGLTVLLALVLGFIQIGRYLFGL